jgi:hypothetical protein
VNLAGIFLGASVIKVFFLGLCVHVNTMRGAKELALQPIWTRHKKGGKRDDGNKTIKERPPPPSLNLPTICRAQRPRASIEIKAVHS